MNKNIILHCHFFKNAGSTIDWALRRCFGHNFYENKEHFYSVDDWNDHLQDLISEKKPQIITSHIFSLRPPEIPGVNIHTLAMVRHPIERVTSVAAFEKMTNYEFTHGDIAQKVSKGGLKEYINAYMEYGNPATIRNIHTLRFAGRDNGRPVLLEDFEQAKITLQKCDTVGLVERFDESMVLFEELLRPLFPGLDFSYVPQNIGQKPLRREQRIESLRKEIGEETFNKLYEKNEFDLRFYKLVEKRLDETINSISDFERKLEIFKKRCGDLQK